MTDKPVYKRILLKLSGEALKDEDNSISPAIVHEMAESIKEIVDSGIDVDDDCAEIDDNCAKSCVAE